MRALIIFGICLVHNCVASPPQKKFCTSRSSKCSDIAAVTEFCSSYLHTTTSTITVSPSCASDTSLTPSSAAAETQHLAPRATRDASPQPACLGDLRTSRALSTTCSCFVRGTPRKTVTATVTGPFFMQASSGMFEKYGDLVLEDDGIDTLFSDDNQSGGSSEANHKVLDTRGHLLGEWYGDYLLAYEANNDDVVSGPVLSDTAGNVETNNGTSLTCSLGPAKVDANGTCNLDCEIRGGKRSSYKCAGGSHWYLGRGKAPTDCRRIDLYAVFPTGRS